MPKGQTAWNKGKSTTYLADKWADPEWAAEQRKRLGGKPGQKKRGYDAGRHKGESHWNTGRPAHNRKEPVIRECLAEGCKTVISTSPSLARVRFCSNGCQAKTTNRRRLHPDIPHTGDEYGNDWVQLRERVLKRDGNECVLKCENPGKRLEAHHLCYDAACRDEGHVVTLCSRCHQGGHRRGLWPIELGKAA